MHIPARIINKKNSRQGAKSAKVIIFSLIFIVLSPIARSNKVFFQLQLCALCDLCAFARKKYEYALALIAILTKLNNLNIVHTGKCKCYGRYKYPGARCGKSVVCYDN